MTPHTKAIRRTVSRIGFLSLLVVPTVLAVSAPARADDSGLVTRHSTHSVPDTVNRFQDAVKGISWKVFGEIDHAAAAAEAGLKLRPRTVILFGNPKTGTAAMQTHPTLAIDLPMRVLVWEDDQGGVFITRSSGDHIATRVFGRHGIQLPAEARRSIDGTLEALTSKAAD